MPNLPVVSLPNLPLEPIGLIFIPAAIIAAILYLYEYNKRKKLEASSAQFLEQIKAKGWETLNQSIQKSQNILGEAELEGVKIAAQSKMETAKMEEQFKANLDEILNTSRQTISSAQGTLLQFMQDLQRRSAEFEEASKNAGQERINQLFDRVEQRLADFLVQTEQKTTTSIELELRASRQMIDTYKGEQLKLIDENIVAMMEQTLAIVLGKKLSLKDSLDLIYEALEKAKVEKFIV